MSSMDVFISWRFLFFGLSGSGVTLSFVTCFYMFWQRAKLYWSLSLELKNTRMLQEKKEESGRKKQHSALEKKENLRSFEETIVILWKNKKLWAFSIFWGFLQAASLIIMESWRVGKLESWLNDVTSFLVLIPLFIPLFIIVLSPIAIVLHSIIIGRLEKIIPLLEEKTKV